MSFQLVKLMKKQTTAKTVSLFLVSFLLAGACAQPEQDEQQESPTVQTLPPDSADIYGDVDAQDFERDAGSSGQLIYVPVYSHIYQLNQRKTFNLTATLSIRNTDIQRSMTLKRVLYYDSQGNLVKIYLDEPMTIKPLASTSFVVEEDDLRGGVGANFIVNWTAEQPVTPPVIEAVMISTSQQQGISFLSQGRILQEF